MVSGISNKFRKSGGSMNFGPSLGFRAEGLGFRVWGLGV